MAPSNRCNLTEDEFNMLCDRAEGKSMVCGCVYIYIFIYVYGWMYMCIYI
jgi:hypothetical protein